MSSHLVSGLGLMTARAACDYKKCFLLFDPVRIEMSFQQLRKASVGINFRFFHDMTNDLHATAEHKIVFVDRASRICAVPDDFRRAIEGHLTRH
jgi:acyl-CoA thioesterase FadM